MSKPVLWFKRHFFDNDCHVLSKTEGAALATFLKELRQTKAYDSAFLGTCESKKGIYAYQFCTGYAVYWRFELEAMSAPSITRVPGIKRIRILKVKQTTLFP